MIKLEDIHQENLGENCRKIRIEKGISVKDFASYARTTRQSVFNFETGKTQSLKLFLAYLKLYREVSQ